MKYLATHNVATQLCSYVTMPPLHGFTSVWLCQWWCSVVDGYVPIRYWIQTLLVTLLVTGS